MAEKGNKVFYGEYTLEHWIELLIKRNIVLPPYQRYFVWSNEKTKKLIESIKGEEFIPPVTIGVYKEDKKTFNLIIDGQQRLTSILLAAIGYFPDRKKYKKEIDKFANENDDKESIDDSESIDDEIENMIEWQMNSLIEGNNSIKEIENSISEGKNGFYTYIGKLLSDEDLKKYYLGFSYLVPNANDDDNSQQEYYSTVFRNINIQGETLSVLESREALYYLHSEYKDFFHPTFLDAYKVNGGRIDFVRYLAFLSQYNKNNNPNRLAYGYSKKMEKYYEEYIYSIVGGKEKSIFSLIKDYVGNGNYRDRLEKCKECIEELDLERNYSSIIDLDMYFFGLIYHTIFKNKKFDYSQKVVLKERINNKIKDLKDDYYHKKTPSALVHIKARVANSIKIYGDYLDEQA